MTDRPIKIEVVTPVHNRREMTLQCLRSLSEINSEGLDVHVIVVDDGSTDGTSEAIRAEFPGVQIIAGNGDLWFTEGTNVGVRAALENSPDFVVMMNDDQVFDPNFLVTAVRTALENPRSIVGSLLVMWDDRETLFQVSPQWSTWQGGWRHWYKQTIHTVPDRPWHVGLIVGNCLLVPATAFHEAGLMNSDRYPNFGDAEFTPRLKKRGWDLLIDPDSVVYCQPNAVPPAIRAQSLSNSYRTLIVDLKSGPNLRRRLYANLDSAPSKLHGITAFLIFLARLALSRTHEKIEYGRELHETPLNELFADAVVDAKLKT